MHKTLEKFGYPQTLLKEFEHWCVLLRPAQVTLGALVLCAKHDATSLGDLPAGAHAELKTCTHHIEMVLMRFRAFDKINYLALMMVDPQVHFHVLPRYAKPQSFENVMFPDHGWPALPDFKSSPTLDDATRQKLHATLLDAFAQVV
jgi:diadenosine tetraphosphate (Ap4A) HIT family hydrolase